MQSARIKQLFCSSSIHSQDAVADPAPTLQPKLQQKQIVVSRFLLQRPWLFTAQVLHVPVQGESPQLSQAGYVGLRSTYCLAS